ncbi:MAG: hypothetical protein QMD00_03875 [Hadesarchaea archaeon]|nr:hypothetical protein [Hadesarchaea archaeon]
MRKVWLLIPVVLLLMLAAAPPASNWKWRTHGGVYGSRGISVVAHERLRNDPNPTVASTVSNLKFELIRPGSRIPDTWRQEPYFLYDPPLAPREHWMTPSRDAGVAWLRLARTAAAANEWDNVSYYLGIASHFWAHVTEYTQHDNAERYYELRYLDPDAAYRAWAEKSNHLKWQVEFYRPKDPALIVQASGAPYSNLDDFIPAAKTQINRFIDRTMPPSPDSEVWMTGWLGDWIRSRKCEASDYSSYHDGNIDNVHYGAKELIDMATELVYSGWVYALGIQNSVSADRITWTQWWSREHREPGIVYIGF